MAGIVAIIGRPNVGKSTFFNRLVGFRKAIVDEVSGVTRDRHYGKTEWNGVEFNVIDTGGYIMHSKEVFDIEIKKQVEIAIQEAHVLIFVVDVTNGITDLDESFAGMIRKGGKKCLLVANKVDTHLREPDIHEFYRLGLGDIFPISAINGSGTGDLLDEIVKSLPKDLETEIESDLPKLAIVGRPNAGKSSLLNALIGEERNIVTPIAGTTRDTTNVHYKAFGFEFILVDTAGIRKRGKVNEDLEFYSVLRAIRAIENSDVCLLMIDVEQGFGAQDLNIFHLIQKNSKGVVILLNKWDLIEKDTNLAKQMENEVKQRLAPFTDLPVIFTSATNKQRIHKALETALKVHQNRTKKIKTRLLNDYFLPIIEQKPPPAIKGKYIKIKFVTQLPTHAPAFAFFCNLPQYVKEPYKRFLENKLREEFDFSGVPVKIFIRKK